MTRLRATLLEDHYTFMIISRSVLLKMRNDSDKRHRKIQNTHFVLNNSPRPPDSCAVYEAMWKGTSKPERPQMKIRHMRIAYWITKFSHTLRTCNSLLTAFPRQKCLLGSASMLHVYTCLVCLVLIHYVCRPIFRQLVALLCSLYSIR